MGDLERDTAVEAVGDGRYAGTPSADWEIWGPMGGYLASFALRAVGAELAASGAGEGWRPTSFSCHYLGVAAFEPIDIVVTERKGGKVARTHRVEITQGDRLILDAMTWSTVEVPGLEHDETVPPEVRGFDELKTVDQLVADLPEEERTRPFRFWENLEAVPIDFELTWPPDGPRPARWREWLRFRPTAAWDDPWVDACRSVILVDLPSWPAGHRPHAWQSPPFIAPTLDLNVAFHRPTSGDEWLLCDGAAPLSTAGLLPWTARVWTPSGSLAASGGGQCLYRRTTPA